MAGVKIGIQTTSATRYDLSVDIWSLGATLFHFLARRHPYESLTDDKEVMYRLVSEQVNTTPLLYRRISETAISLLRRMMDPQPGPRPTATQCLQDTWFDWLKTGAVASLEKLNTDDDYDQTPFQTRVQYVPSEDNTIIANNNWLTPSLPERSFSALRTPIKRGRGRTTASKTGSGLSSIREHAGVSKISRLAGRISTRPWAKSSAGPSNRARPRVVEELNKPTKRPAADSFSDRETFGRGTETFERTTENEDGGETP